MKNRRKYKYINITIFVFTLLIVFSLSDSAMPRLAIEWIGGYGYIGAMATGIFFVSLFTVVPASIILLSLAEQFNPALIAVAAGLGASIGDILLFKFFKDGLFSELRTLFKHSQLKRFTAVFRTKLFLWLTPLVGAVIIASPLPDEIGIGLLGLSQIRAWQFFALSLVLNTLGILAIVTVASAV